MKCDWYGKEHDAFSINKAYADNICQAENILCKWCFVAQSVFNAEKLKIQNKKLHDACKETAHKLLIKEGLIKVNNTSDNEG